MSCIKINKVTVLNYREFIETDNLKNDKFYNITKDTIVFWVNSKEHIKHMMYGIGMKNIKKYEEVLKENGYKHIEKDQ